MKKIILFLFFVSALSWPVCSNADLVSTFDSGDEGWTTEGTAFQGIHYDSEDGNPPGSVYGIDNANQSGWWYFHSPSSWNGDWSQYKGGTLSFDLKFRSGTDIPSPDNYIVWIEGTSGELTWGMDSDPPNTTWTHYQITLSHETFDVTEEYFNGVMSNVVGLKIRGEYRTGADQEGLDNVRVSAVPVPGALWLLGSGIIGLIAIKRKK